VIVVSDTSPLRGLLLLDLLHALPSLFGEVLIPPAVADELKVNVPGMGSLDAAQVSFIKIMPPSGAVSMNTALDGLGKGECEAILLAAQLGADYLLVDDRSARQAAVRMGVTPLGLLGVLVRAKEAGLVKTVAPLLDRLEDEMTFRFSTDLRQRILRMTGEV